MRYGTIRGTASHYSFSEPTILVAPGKKGRGLYFIRCGDHRKFQRREQNILMGFRFSPVSFSRPARGCQHCRTERKIPAQAVLHLSARHRTGTLWLASELRSEYSHFPTWDHWPVNQIPSDGRFAIFPDHYGSAAIMSPNPKNAWIVAPGQRSTYFLFGLTDQNAPELAALDRSWLQPRKLEREGRRVHGCVRSVPTGLRLNAGNKECDQFERSEQARTHVRGQS